MEDNCLRFDLSFSFVFDFLADSDNRISEDEDEVKKFQKGEEKCKTCECPHKRS